MDYNSIAHLKGEGIAMTQEQPPSVRLVVRVGVTGHRQKALEDQGYDAQKLEESVGRALDHINNTVDEIATANADLYLGPPSLRVISPLAEGADRIIAREALRKGYELQSPLPFHRQEYEQDFLPPQSSFPKSREEFLELLGRASFILELDGSRATENESYQTVGRTVLRQCDVLLAIWDGKPAEHIGGTAEILSEALRNRIPTVWIESKPPHRILKPDSNPANPETLNLEDLTQQIESLLLLPNEPEIKKYKRFKQEHRRRWKLALLFRLFCKIFFWKWPLPKQLRTKSFKEQGRNQWLQPWNPLTGNNDNVGEQIEKSYRLYYIWADGLADLLADRYRSSFVATYLMGAFAVLSAYLGFHTSHSWYLVELALIAGILALVAVGKGLRWHERWVDYRLLAEGLRQMEFLASFARVSPSFEPPPFVEYKSSGINWFEWYFRAIIRQANLLEAQIDNHYLDVCKRVLEKSIGSQLNYHNSVSHRFHALYHRLHIWIAPGLFFLTILACVAHLMPEPVLAGLVGEHKVKPFEIFLAAIAIVLPAFGAAVEGIAHQGEFGQIAKRSKAILSNLRSLVQELQDGSQPITFRRLGRIAESFSRIQLTEQAHWKSLFGGKSIPLP